ncbi:cytidine deaminase [Paracoccaceae bacterium GXU_MW_L88]
MDLIEKALEAMARAYVPYSQFHVGAAIEAENGDVFQGCNVENVAYPEGTCAEAGAIAAMVLGGQTRIKRIAVTANGSETITPCGGCRQKIAEFAPPEAEVILAGPEGERARMTVKDLLPGAFAKAHLSGNEDKS